MALTNALEITISDVKRFKNCRRQWDWASSFRRNLVPKARAAHFVFGDLFHRALEEFYMNGAKPDEWFANASNEFLSTVEPSSTPNYERLLEDARMGPPLLRMYVRWAEKNDDFRVISMEERLTLRLNNSTPGHFFSFKYDMLVQRGNQLFIHDFKTTRQMNSNYDWLIFDDQAVAYAWAYEQATGKQIDGVIYTFIKKAMPVAPRILASGKVSTSTTTNMTTEEYLRVLREQYQDPADYAAVLCKLDEQELDNFFVRASARSSKLQKQLLGEQIKELARLMADPELFVYPSPDKQRCLACDFKEPCILASNGLSPEAMFIANYKQGEPRE